MLDPILAHLLLIVVTSLVWFPLGCALGYLVKKALN